MLRILQNKADNKSCIQTMGLECNLFLISIPRWSKIKMSSYSVGVKTVCLCYKLSNTNEAQYFVKNETIYNNQLPHIPSEKAPLKLLVA